MPRAADEWRQRGRMTPGMPMTGRAIRWLAAAVALLIALPALTGAARADDRVWRLGVLTPGASALGTPNAPGSITTTTLPVLAAGGFVEGRNLAVIGREARGDPAALPRLAAELAAERVDVAIAVGDLAARAISAAAPSVPIVLSFSAEDPVESGLARSLARPGGRVTGIFFRAVEADAKRLELLVEALPTARRLGFLAAPTLERARMALLDRTAAQLRVGLVSQFAARRADYEKAFQALKTDGAEGVIVQATTVFGGDAPVFAPIAAREKLPTICEWDYMARQGCLIGFGADVVALRRRTGDYVLRILKGADPAEMPIERPDRFTLAVNLRTASEIGVEIAPSVMARADEVIE